MWKKLPLIWKILIGMVLGMVWGIVAVALGWDSFTIRWIKPWGTIFLNMLKLVAVPLIFVSLVSGIASITDISKLSRIGWKTIVLYILTTLFAITVGLVLVNIVKPGNTFPEEKKIEIQQKFSHSVTAKQKTAEEQMSRSPLQFVVDMVPENVVQAASDNSKMLQVIFFAIVFGIAIVLLPSKNVATVKSFIDGLNDIILKIIDFFMGFAPYGVFALLAALVVDFSGDIALFKALGLYFITVVAGLFLLILFFYPTLMALFAGVSPLKFLKAILPTQLVAFSTSSSAATLPVTKRQVENELYVQSEISNFVLPIGVTINMDGTSCYQAIAAIFIAEVFGIDLTFGQILIILLTALLASIGSPGVPGGSIVMLIIVLTSVGLPVEGLALILGVDRPLDMLRTAVNVTGDSTVASLVAKSEGAMRYPWKKNNKARKKS
ncbi:MAG: dicarboxylate/amino acid:cation symporter [Chlorobi bacterium]|nr:dicarboxylate/amino acid:cation symporter [Chlorobiota bacterium]